LKVTPQGYVKHLRTKTRPDKYARLLADMRAVLDEEEFNINYGKRRMYEKLQIDYDCPYSYNTVAKIMRANGLLQKPNKLKSLILHPFYYIQYLLESLPNISMNGLEVLLPWSKTLPDYCYAPYKHG